MVRSIRLRYREPECRARESAPSDAGQIAEVGPVRDLYASPQHPYTQRLLASFPAIGGPRELAPAIPGVPPDPAEQPSGCRFAPRCHRGAERCVAEAPELRSLSDDRLVRCHFAPWPAGGTA